MATVTEVRAWLREEGHDVPARGRLDPAWQKIYDDAHPDGDWDAPDDPGGDFAEPADPPPPPASPERPPRTPKSDRAARRAQPVGQRTGRLLGALRGDSKTTGKARPKPKPRISLENFTARAWSALGRMMKPISPATGTCLQAQAAMAGVLLEDVARGTIVDRLLQGPARMEDKLDKGFALLGPPVIVFAMEMNHAAVTSGARTPKEGMMREAMLTPVLREALRTGLEVSEAYADQIKARLEREQRFDEQVDELIALIFGQATAEAQAEQPEQEMAGV
jgi:hypothetical protein